MIARRMFLAVSIVAALLAKGDVLAQSPKSAATIVIINGEMCGGCVKSMQATLVKVPGVASVQGDVAKKTMTITPKPQAGLSAKAVWEAIEAAGTKPAKLSGPGGTFTAKPKA